MPYKKLPRKIAYQRNDAPNQSPNSCCIQPTDQINKKNHQNEIEFESKIQLALNNMNRHFFQLKNDLDNEKEKTKALSARMNNMLILFDCIKRV